jgi:membrane-associated phospholipid phosphatase
VRTDGGSAVTTTITDVGYGRAPSRLERLLYAPAVPDWIVAGWFFTVVVGLTRGRPSAARDYYALLSLAILVFFLAGVYLFRLRVEARAQPSFKALCAYHLLPVVAVLALYFHMRPILPIINATTYDDLLYNVDLSLLGFEPTLRLEVYTTRTVVEWFAFFYYSYFFLVASFIFVMIFSSRSEKRLAYFATGILAIVSVGHFLYALVPGFGPYAHLAHDYRRPLPGGPFYNLVLEAVAGAGPLRDIFPSLHTALPTFCALFAWRHYRRVAPIVTFFSLNIMLATIVLRWHYVADVLAGLILAVTAFLAGPWLVERYQARRVALGLAFRRW